jgi:ABC-type sugar transport system ATPase subunit
LVSRGAVSHYRIVKSTHIKCVAGIYRIDGGEFRFDGVRATIHGRKETTAS